MNDFEKVIKQLDLIIAQIEAINKVLRDNQCKACEAYREHGVSEYCYTHGGSVRSSDAIL